MSGLGTEAQARPLDWKDELEQMTISEPYDLMLHMISYSNMAGQLKK